MYSPVKLSHKFFSTYTLKVLSYLLIIYAFIFPVPQAFAVLAASKSITLTFEILDISKIWGNSSGDKENPFIIQDKEGLDLINKYLFVLNSNDIDRKYFKLSGDIAYVSNDNFTPIGTLLQPFRGVFDGNNCKITGINYSGDCQYVGLFGYVDGGIIQNVRLEDNAFESNYPDAFAGSIAGFISADKIVDCVVISGSVKAQNGTVGGIVGSTGTNSSIENCLYLAENLTGTTNGAIVGNNKGKVTLCYFTGENFTNAIGENLTSQDNIVHAEKAHIVALDKTENTDILEFILSEDVNIESVDEIQADDYKLIYGEKIYAGESVDIIIRAVPEAVFSADSLDYSVNGETYNFLMPNENVIVKTLNETSHDISPDILDLSCEDSFDVNISENDSFNEIIVTDNNSIRTLNIRDNKNLTLIELEKSNVEIVDLNGCENLMTINIKSCDALTYLDVSNTKISMLDLQGCRNLRTLLCSSCDIVRLNIDACTLLENINFKNNRLTRFDASMLNHLESLDHENQHLEIWFNATHFNILDILFGGVDNESNVDTNDIANVKNIQAFNEDGDEIFVTYDDETGEVNLEEEPAELRYKYITGFKNTSMDVTISTNSGDCNIGPVTILLLVVICISINIRHHKIYS